MSFTHITGEVVIDTKFKEDAIPNPLDLPTMASKTLGSCWLPGSGIIKDIASFINMSNNLIFQYSLAPILVCMIYLLAFLITVAESYGFQGISTTSK